jgi:hypothetical protein
MQWFRECEARRQAARQIEGGLLASEPSFARSDAALEALMVRVAVSLGAYRAIKASLPAGSVILKPERDRRGRYSSCSMRTQRTA